MGECLAGLPVWPSNFGRIVSQAKHAAHTKNAPHRSIDSSSLSRIPVLDRTETRVRRNATHQTGDAGKDAFLMAGIFPHDPYPAHSHGHRGEVPPPRPSRCVGILASGSCGGWRSGTLPFLDVRQESFDAEITTPVRPGLLGCPRKKCHEWEKHGWY